MFWYLRHPVHGQKVAISDMEVAADLEEGWEEYDPNSSDEEYEEQPVVGKNKLRGRRRKASDEG